MVDVGMLVCTQGMYNNKKSNFAGQEIFYKPENKMDSLRYLCSRKTV